MRNGNAGRDRRNGYIVALSQQAHQPTLNFFWTGTAQIEEPPFQSHQRAFEDVWRDAGSSVHVPQPTVGPLNSEGAVW
jgi:hypothetical protein